MIPESLGIFSFLISLRAFQLSGLLFYATALSYSSSVFGASTASTILPLIVIFPIIGAVLTGLNVYALERI
ncbi:hypothetical protein AUI06_10550 [archaeon 13_2_20CM_2_52_21]|nr:MAG: hypothetical protein AUI06_10550 [archaeon 13_2_20CM_2_52_21]